MSVQKICPTKKRSPSRAYARRLKLMALIAGPMVCLSVSILQPAQAFLNCLTPNMYKMGKVGQQGGIYASHPGERASWYPQMNAYQSYGQNPMSRFFKPKWMSGSLFGPKRWMDWRMNAANMNYQRPNQMAYWPPLPSSAAAQYPPLPGGGGGKQSYNQYSEQLSLPPFTPSMQLPPTPAGYNAAGYYGQSPSSQLNGAGNALQNDGWSYPSVSPYSRPPSSQTQPSSYLPGDSYTVSPNGYQPAKQQVDPYGTKGGSGSKNGKNTTSNSKLYNSKRILVADGA